MTTHLIVQSPGLDLALIDQTAALCEANGTQWISKSAAKLMDVQRDADIEGALAAWAKQKH